LRHKAAKVIRDGEEEEKEGNRERERSERRQRGKVTIEYSLIPTNLHFFCLLFNTFLCQ
jgi:hypothetical protein